MASTDKQPQVDAVDAKADEIDAEKVAPENGAANLYIDPEKERKMMLKFDVSSQALYCSSV